MIHHPHVQLVQRAMNAGRIEKGDLPARLVEDADDTIARRLRLLGNDRDLLPENAVEERRLAGVGAAYQRYGAGAHGSPLGLLLMVHVVHGFVVRECSMLNVQC